MRKLLLVSMVIAVSGCAELTAYKAITDTGKAVAEKLVDRVPINEGQASVNGEITDPQFTIDTFYIQGVRCEVRSRGVQFKGTISGQGNGGPAPIDQDLRERLDRIIRNPSLRDKVIDEINHIASSASSQPISVRP